MFNYVRDPAKIYQLSFEQVRLHADLSFFPIDLVAIAERLVHACGMPGITRDIAWGGTPAHAARKALFAGAPILVDAEMVRVGISKQKLPAQNLILCTIDDSKTPELAKSKNTTRSAAAVELWTSHLKGAIVVIGNAPTALFHLLELIADGAPKPAVIFGFPVGFIGAEESKKALIQHAQNVPFITLQGRLGGSAIAAAAVNSILVDISNGD